jgi:CRISPR-associated endonuclease/helicase Cas3
MTGPDLSAGEFRDFFHHVHGWTKVDGWTKPGPEPFPWQERLLRDWVAGPKGWPGVLDLPTGSGKTAALDVAVFHLAMEAHKREGRHAPVRIAFVVDRRLIVDDAFARAQRIANTLAAAAVDSAAPGSVRKVVERLGHLAERPDRPLLVRRLRGGVPREDDWARTPCQPTILCSTVDQVGSRLLFRGYGVSDSMKPVHAGLLGSDCLILLDEAHLSRPFRQTLQAVAAHRKRWRDPERTSPAPFALALLSATPGDASDDYFKLEQDDRDHRVLRDRLEAPKPTFLRDIKGKQGQAIDDQRADEVAEAVNAAFRHLERQKLGSQPVVGVVVNRVVRARYMFRRLREAYGPSEDGAASRADVVLVIGSAREADRAALIVQLDPIKTGAKAERGSLPRPMIVVATQTIEAGADLDFDALITEIAPLDALKQRFGRLNRAGRSFVPYAAILAHREDVRPGKDGDPVYGQAAANTWAALQKLVQSRGDADAVDFGASRPNETPWIGEISSAQMESEDLLAAKPDAPIMMPAYVDLWSQTSPRPAADPAVSLFLHGPDRSPATVQIVWRADLDLERSDLDGKALLAAMPPKPGETVEVSLAAARRWLHSIRGERGDAAIDFADVPERDREEEPEPERGPPAFRWAGPESERSESIRARKLRPNDLIVVPADYGGCDEFGWNPDYTVPVADVADRAAAPFAARRYALRLTPALIRAAAASGDHESAIAERATAGVFADNLVDLIAAWSDGSGRKRPHDLVRALSGASPPQRIGEALRKLESAKALRPVFPYGEDEEGRARGMVLLAPKGIPIAPQSAEELIGGTPTTEDDWQGSLSGDAQTLAEHSQQVKDFARAFAGRAGVTDITAADLALAAYLHDAGKADPRFQAMLYGGSRFAVDETNVLAKSLPGVGPDAWDRAGLPRPWRHEALSVRIAREYVRFEGAHDKELVLWLIGVHHGYGRPLFPHADEDPPKELPDVLGGIRAAMGPGPQSLAFDFEGWDWAQIFERLKRRYGVWELARMEAIVRLADHRASEAAAERGSGDTIR